MIPIGPLALYTDNLKTALEAESSSWVRLFAKHMNQKYLVMMDTLLQMMDEWSIQLSRPIKDLDDIRACMATLQSIKENEIRIDMEITPIEVSIYILHYSTHL